MVFIFQTVFFEIFLDTDDYDDYEYEGLEEDDYEADTVTGGCGQKLPTKLIPDVYVIMVGQLSDQLSGQMVNRGTLHTCYTLPDVY